VATLVSFHAHPDDEAIGCGGTLAKAAAEGHRVVVVVATRGEQGEVAEGVLAPGESLAERRVVETMAAARVLGVHRVAFLGYRDSGMMGTAANDDPGCFWRADLDEAAARLAAILDEEAADVLTVYDDHGLYGHPDHIQVHRVGTAAARLAGTARVYEGTVDRDYVQDLLDRAAELGMTTAPDLPPDPESFGSPAEVVTTVVDVRDHLDAKRAAMAAHASQIAETSFFLGMPPDAFVAVWGQEWYIRQGARPGAERETSLFDGLA